MGAEGDSSEPKVSGEEGAGAQINIRCSNGSKFSVRANLESTVGEFKVVLAQNCDIPADQQRLIYKGRILKDDQTLTSYGLLADHTVHMVRAFAAAASTPAAPNVTSASPNTAPGVTRGVGSTEREPLPMPDLASMFGQGLNPLGGGGAPSLFGAGLPEFEQVQQQLTQNPNMMRDIMNMPAMQSLMNNPELMRGLIMNNPQMRDIIDRNPELGHVLNDPGTLRQTLEAARNPELMREMMRNTDRAMSNIEASPEGFNMLRRMYENVQEPLLNATTMTGNSGNDLGSNPFSALLGNQGGAQARDGSNNPSTTGTETAAGSTVPNTNPLPNPWGNAGGGNQPNTTRTNPAGRAPGIGVLGGLGGLDLPAMGEFGGGMPDTTLMNQLLENPAISQMLQSVLSNPQYLDQILNLNPEVRAIVDAYPQFREMMLRPEVIRQLTTPESMQQVVALQQMLLRQQANQNPAPAASAAAAAAAVPRDPALDLLMVMFGGLGAGSLAAANNPNVPPEELYATQLAQLREMGFFDTAENIRALQATSGNVHAAVERLLGNPGA